MRYCLTASAACVISLLFCGGAFAEELRPSFLMLADPEIPPPPPLEYRLPDKIIEKWRSSLQRPESFYRLSATIDIRNASRAGFDDVKAAVPELRQLLRGKDTTPDVRRSAAITLIELDARQAADELFQASREMGSQFRQLVEPALAEWDYRPLREVWRQRLQQEATPRRELILACEGSGRVRDEQALTVLLSLVHASERPRDARLSAATAAGQIAGRGLEPEVRKLLAGESPSLIHRLCAVALLRQHESEQARQLLTELFHDPAGPVATAAIERLYAIDPALVPDLAPRAWEHPDAKVRRVAADCLIALATPERVEILASHLSDRHPDLRIHIREALLEFAQRPDLEPVVRDSAVDVLNSDDWRGQEQSCLILGQLDHEAVAPRLVELLKSERPEVQIASAWALRKVVVKEVLPDMLEHAQRQTENPPKDDPAAFDRQVAHLFEAMAIMDYRPAIPLMRRYISFRESSFYQRLSRGAAIWGLGHLFAGAPDEQLAGQLMGRILTLNTDNPDIEIVISMSAISLGRMKATSQLQPLKSFSGSELGHGRFDESLRWAIRELSGEVIPYPKTDPRVLLDWRIQPPLPD